VVVGRRRECGVVSQRVVRSSSLIQLRSMNTINWIKRRPTSTNSSARSTASELFWLVVP
jgi:hypothetical protein